MHERTLAPDASTSANTLDETRIARHIRAADRSGARVVLEMLRAEIGIARTVRVLMRFAWMKAKGEPFRALGPPSGARDRLSRRQAAGLILLDRALQGVLAEDARRQVLRRAVREAGIVFLDRMVPEGSAVSLATFARDAAARFFNAEGEAHDLPDGSFALDVKRCLFVELCAHADAPHLAPLFCEADEAFFDGARRPIELRRTKTLARDASPCDFRFHARE